MKGPLLLAAMLAVGIPALIIAAPGTTGNEFHVTTFTTNNQNRQVVATNSSGSFVVVWQSPQDGSGTGIFGQIFDSAGTRVGGEFRVNTYRTYPESPRTRPAASSWRGPAPSRTAPAWESTRSASAPPHLLRSRT